MSAGAQVFASFRDITFEDSYNETHGLAPLESEYSQDLKELCLDLQKLICEFEKSRMRAEANERTKIRGYEPARAVSLESALIQGATVGSFGMAITGYLSGVWELIALGSLLGIATLIHASGR